MLVPQPSYPLFEHLTRLDGVDAAAYALATTDAGGSTSTRRGRGATETRACWWSPEQSHRLVPSRDDLRALAVAAARGAALIVDEVFADYPLDRPTGRSRGSVPTAARAHVQARRPVEVGGLPQVKLGWIAVDGPSRSSTRWRGSSSSADTYLSVSTPVQVAAPELIAGGAGRARRSSSGCAPI